MRVGGVAWAVCMGVCHRRRRVSASRHRACHLDVLIQPRGDYSSTALCFFRLLSLSSHLSSSERLDFPPHTNHPKNYQKTGLFPVTPLAII